MKVCLTCKKELRCTKTGATLHYGNGHCYAGDAFQCPSCGVETICANERPYQLEPDRLKLARRSIWFIEMVEPGKDKLTGEG